MIQGSSQSRTRIKQTSNEKLVLLSQSVQCWFDKLIEYNIDKSEMNNYICIFVLNCTIYILYLSK